MKRSEFRENVVLLLYTQAVGGEFDASEYDNEIIERFQTIVDKLEEIDTVIKNNLVGYTIDRLNFVDQAIFRNSVYEMKYTDLPHQISINEAINLTKKYSNLDDDAAKRFNNKLLDNISKYLEQ